MGLDAFLAEYGGKAFPLPKGIAGAYAGKNLVIVGDAACAWADLEAFGCRVDHHRGRVGKDGWDFLTINKIVETFPGNIEHAYSNQPYLLHKFIAARRNEYSGEFKGPVHTHACNEGAQWFWPWGGHGTSALGAILTALGLGYDAIVLCGVPLDDGPHNGEPPWRKTAFATSEACGPKDYPNTPDKHWQRARDNAFDGKVKSMSGRTRQWLGSV